MGESSKLMGLIRVDLYKKDGRHIVREEHNAITKHGLNLAMTHGLSSLLWATKSGPNSGKMQITGETGKAVYPGSDPTDVTQLLRQFTNIWPANPVWQDKVCNLLLNLPAGRITSETSLYYPKGSDMLGYAFDETSSGTTRGKVIEPALNEDNNLSLVRRFEYPDDMAGSFNVIAMSQSVPEDTSKIGLIAKNPFNRIVLSDHFTNRNYFDVYPEDDTLVFQFTDAASSNVKQEINMRTGEVSNGSVRDCILDPYSYQYLSVFNYNGIRYIAYAYSVSGLGNYVALDGYNSEGGQVVTSSCTDSNRYSTVTGSFIRLGNQFVAIPGNNSSGKAKVVVEDSNGHLVISATSITVKELADLSMGCMIGNQTTGYYNIIGAGQTYNRQYGFTIGLYDTDLNLLNVLDYYCPGNLKTGAGLIGTGMNLGGLDYMLLLKDNDTQQNATLQYWADKTDLDVYPQRQPYLIEVANLISYHYFDSPIVKEAGDKLIVTYRYQMV